MLIFVLDMIEDEEQGVDGELLFFKRRVESQRGVELQERASLNVKVEYEIETSKGLEGASYKRNGLFSGRESKLVVLAKLALS